MSRNLCGSFWNKLYTHTSFVVTVQNRILFHIYTSLIYKETPAQKIPECYPSSSLKISSHLRIYARHPMLTFPNFFLIVLLGAVHRSFAAPVPYRMDCKSIDDSRFETATADLLYLTSKPRLWITLLEALVRFVGQFKKNFNLNILMRWKMSSIRWQGCRHPFYL